MGMVLTISPRSSFTPIRSSRNPRRHPIFRPRGAIGWCFMAPTQRRSENRVPPAQNPASFGFMYGAILLSFWFWLSTDSWGQGFGTNTYSDELVKKAQAGDPSAQLDLGLCYSRGNGVKASPGEGVAWLEKAANQGYAPAEFVLSSAYYYGSEGLEMNRKKSAVWAERSAKQGNASGQLVLGMLYLYGDGVQKNEKEAFEWLKKSAEQGNASAQNYLGRCYRKGIGVERDEREAFAWIRKSAEQGLSSGQNNLGICYLQGMGVKKSEVEAEKWFSKAAAQGNKDAENALLQIKAGREAKKILQETESKAKSE